MYASERRSDELDAQSDISMTSLTYEDGLAEIDSFFESPPDHRSSNVGDLGTNTVPSGASGVAPSAPSLVQQPQAPDLQVGQVDMPTDHEADQGSNEEFAALMEEFKQVTGAGAELAINPKGQLDFILNAAKSLPAEPVPDGYDYALQHDFTSAKTGQPQDSWESLDPGVATTVTEAPQVESGMSAPAPSSPTESETPSPPTFDSVTLASLQEDEDLAATSASREERVLDRSSPATHPSPQQHLSQDQIAQARGDAIHKDSSPAAENQRSPRRHDIPQQQLARSPIALPHETSSVDITAQFQPPKEVSQSKPRAATPPPAPSPQQTTPTMEAILQTSPTMPSSEGKHILLEEMRSEEYDTEPNVAPGTFPQPDFISGTKPSELEVEARDQAAISQQILKDASESQRKAEALVAVTRSEEDQLARARMVANDEETDEDADSDFSSHNAPDQGVHVLQESQKASQALEELKATVTSLLPPGSQAEAWVDTPDPGLIEDSKNQADNDSEDEDDDSDSRDRLQVSEPIANAVQTATEPESTEVSQPPQKAKPIVTRSRPQSEQKLDVEYLSNDIDNNAEARSNSDGDENTHDQAAVSQQIVGDRSVGLPNSKAMAPRITRSRVQPASKREAPSDNGEPEDKDVENKAMEADQAPSVVRVYPVKSIKQPAGSSSDPTQPTEEVTEPANKFTKSKKPAKASMKTASSKSKKAAQPRPQKQNVTHRHTRLSTLNEDDEDTLEEENSEAEATIEPVSKSDVPVKRKASSSQAPPAKRPKQESPRRTLRSRQAEDKSIKEGSALAAKTTPATEPIVPAKRKATATLAPQAKRGNQQLTKTSRGSSSQASAQEVAEVDTAPNQYHRVSNREQNNLHDKVWYNQDVASGPRQTRGQKKEEDAKVPNASKAAKDRQKKLAK